MQNEQAQAKMLIKQIKDTNLEETGVEQIGCTLRSGNPRGTERGVETSERERDRERAKQ